MIRSCCYLQVSHQFYRLQRFSNTIDALKNNIFIFTITLIIFFAKQLQILNFVLQKSYFKNTSKWIDKIHNKQYNNLSIIML